MDDAVIHIVDDDEALRESLSFLLDSAGFKSQVYACADALLQAPGQLAPGCILTDVRMPGMNGLELVNVLRERGVNHPIIMLTGHADVALAVEAMKAGVCDFLEKPFDDDALLGAISSALESAKPEASETSAAKQEALERLGTLTPREREVFTAIVAGDSNKAAALKLGISPRTVEIYRANVMSKMRAASLSDLVRMALLAE